MQLHHAKTIADNLVQQLAPHCYRIAIAGSIRREKPEVKDIEIVAIPKPYDNVGMFSTGIATVVNQWPKIKGELPCKYTQRLIQQPHSDCIKLDLFFAEPGNWGWIFALRTGPSDYNQATLLKRLKLRGYEAKEGWIWANNRPIQILEEKDLYDRIGLPFASPNMRMGWQEKKGSPINNY